MIVGGGYNYVDRLLGPSTILGSKIEPHQPTLLKEHFGVRHLRPGVQVTRGEPFGLPEDPKPDKNLQVTKHTP